MNAYIFVGTYENCLEYLKEFIKENGFKSHEVDIRNEKIGINEVRILRQAFSLKTNKRLICLAAELTLEAQNALLKNIEELPSGWNLILFADSVESFLPTVRSRCQIKVLSNDNLYSSEQVKIINKLLSIYKGQGWELVFELEQSILKDKRGYDALLFALRNSLMGCPESESSLYYNRCKETLRLLPLVKNNNVQLRIALEKIFIG